MPNGLKMFMSFFDNRELLHRFVSSLSRASRHGNYYGKRRKSESVRLIAGPCVLNRFSGAKLANEHNSIID